MGDKNKAEGGRDETQKKSTKNTNRYSKTVDSLVFARNVFLRDDQHHRTPGLNAFEIYALLTKREVKMAWYWPSSSLVNKGLIIWSKDYTKEFRFCGNKAGNPEQARLAHLARSGSQSQHNPELSLLYLILIYFNFYLAPRIRAWH